MKIEAVVRSKWGQIRLGKVVLSNGRGKTSIRLDFDPPLVLGAPTMGLLSNTEEFNLLSGARLIWGQGMAEDVDDWMLDKEDRLRIATEGGG